MISSLSSRGFIFSFVFASVVANAQDINSFSYSVNKLLGNGKDVEMEKDAARVSRAKAYEENYKKQYSEYISAQTDLLNMRDAELQEALRWQEAENEKLNSFGPPLEAASTSLAKEYARKRDNIYLKWSNNKKALEKKYKEEVEIARRTQFQPGYNHDNELKKKEFRSRQVKEQDELRAAANEDQKANNEWLSAESQNLPKNLSRKERKQAMKSLNAEYSARRDARTSRFNNELEAMRIRQSVEFQSFEASLPKWSWPPEWRSFFVSS